MDNKTILIAEDERLIAEDIKITLEALGYSICDIVNSGEGAIKSVQNAQPDLIVMDIVLHGEMTGIEAATIIQESYNIPIIYLTAYSDDATLEKAKITEPFGYLQKPYSKREFQATIEMALYKHKMDNRLKESENKYRILIENANEAIAVAQEGILKFVNPKIMEITGYNETEMTTRPFLEFIHKDDRDLVYQRYVERMKGNVVSKKYSFRIVRKDSQVRWMEISAVKITWDDQPATLNFLTDITERKLAEDALRASEARYKLLVEGVNFPIFSVDRKGQFLFMNRSAAATFKGAPKDFIGKSMWDLFPKAIAERQMNSMLRCLDSGKVMTVEAESIILGEKRWFETTLSPLRESDGSCNVAICIVIDISNRKLAEKGHQESENRYRELFNHMSSGVAVYEPLNDGENFIFRDMNKAGERISDVQKNDIIGRTVTDVFPYVKQMGLFSVFQHVLKTGIPQHHPIAEYKDNHIDIWVENYVYKLESGEIVAVFDNITEKKQLEEQLIRSQKMEAIGTLAGGVAHDFNNILTPIMGYADMLYESLDNNEVMRADVNEILKGAKRAKDLVQQILMFSRQIDSERQPLKLQTLVNEALKLLRPSIPSTIDIKTDINPSCKKILADPTRIHQVLLNLCTNAFQAMEDSGGTLSIELQPYHASSSQKQYHVNFKEHSYIRLTVRDTGIGMDNHTKKNIFDPYFTTKDVDRGTGLGMSVVHGIVRSHNGEIVVESEPGIGSSLHVFLPVASISDDSDMQEKEYIRPEGGNEHILLVDDEEPIIKLLERMLTPLGYQVTMRTSSIEALEAFRQQPENFDIVITDLTMPNMSGLDLTKEIRKINCNIPIVMITGFSEKVSANIQKDFDIQQIVKKPIVMQKIAIAIRAALAKSYVEVV